MVKKKLNWPLALITSLLLFASFCVMAIGQVDVLDRPVNVFERVATYDVTGIVAEIVTATPDGKTLIYTDATSKEVGFVNISDPAAPVEIGKRTVNGEPTSVAVTPDGKWALVCVAGSPNQLVVLSTSDRTITTTINLGGQPDSIAISSDGRFGAIAIENERDESVNGGAMPQAPAGFLTIVDLVGAPNQWQTRNVTLTGIANRFPEDPEPEFVDINTANQCAVTLQENNHIAIVDLASGNLISHFSAGTTTHAADVVRDMDIAFTGAINNARREPDAIVWTPLGRLVTANEGDYTVGLRAGEFVGGRDFTIFSPQGAVIFEPGAELEQIAVEHGHYPEARSNSKGAEFEGAEIGVYNGVTFLFIGSERGHFVAVYRMDDETNPTFVQVLPTGAEPEGLLAIAQRNLFVTANELAGTISIFRGTSFLANPYPQVVSSVVSWSALSGITAVGNRTLYAVADSAFRPSRIHKIELGNPSWVTETIRVRGNYDLEGISASKNGGFWAVSEGAGNAGGTGLTKNLLLYINPDGSIGREYELPAEINARQVQFGYEGVATNSNESQVYVAFQREWGDDPAGFVKIGRFTPNTGEWRFYHYPIDPAPAVAGAWVGLSEIVRINNTTFAVIERDNQQRKRAQVKRIYSFSIAGLEPVAAGATPPRLTKTLVRDLLTQDNWLLEKVEGLARTKSGNWIVVSDNDGVGETRLLKLGKILE